MSIFGNLFGQKDPVAAAAAAEREAKWGAALGSGRLPDFVEHRLNEASGGRIPWMSTMSPAELLQSRSLGIRPVATVSGTCWYHFGYSWTNGHAEGWHAALDRLKSEAIAAGANAIVDVKMRTINMTFGDSMDFTVFGTAVKIDGLRPSHDPVVATVSAVEFARLLREGIVPTGVAVGAEYDWLTPYSWNATGMGRWQNMQLTELSDFWQSVRQRAVRNLRSDTRSQGNGVLAHTQFGEIFKVERDKQPTRFLARFIILGTTVQCTARDAVMATIRPVIDMRDDLSPLTNRRPHGHTAYPVDSDKDGAI